MRYTIISATYAEASRETILAQTVEAGAVIFNAANRPEMWADAQTKGVAEYVAPPPPTPRPLSNLLNLSKEQQAFGIAIAALTGKPVAEVRAAYETAWKALP